MTTSNYAANAAERMGTMSTPTIGSVIGYVPATEVLAGWAKVATGDGRYVVTKSGACFGREHDRTIPTDLAWDAVGAYFTAKAR